MAARLAGPRIPARQKAERTPLFSGPLRPAGATRVERGRAVGPARTRPGPRWARSVLAMDVADDLELFAQMCFLRHFEERTDALYRQGLIHGPVHLGLGQEAIAAGAASMLRPDDYSLGTYRATRTPSPAARRPTRCSPSCWARPAESAGARAAR